MENLWTVLCQFLNSIRVYDDVAAHVDTALNRATCAGPEITCLVFAKWIKTRQDLINSRNEDLFREVHGGPLKDLLNTMNEKWFTSIGDANKAVIWDYLVYFVELSKDIPSFSM